MSPRSALVPFTLAAGLVLSLASSVPAEESWNNQDLSHGPSFQTRPGQITRFRLHFLAPLPTPSDNSLMVEAKASLIPIAGGVFDTGVIGDSGSWGGSDTDALADTGALQEPGDTSSGIFDSGALPEGTDSRVHLRLWAGEQQVLDSDLVYDPVHQTSSIRWFGVLDGCNHLSDSRSMTLWTRSENGMCEGELLMEWTSDVPMALHWGAKLHAEDTWQPCDANGEPVGCTDAPPEATVLVEILPA